MRVRVRARVYAHTYTSADLSSLSQGWRMEVKHGAFVEYGEAVAVEERTTLDLGMYLTRLSLG